MKLKQAPNFLFSDDYHDIERLAWKFAKARFRNDIGTMTELAASDNPQPPNMDIYTEIPAKDLNGDDLEFFIVKSIYQAEDGTTQVSCEMQPQGESYLYLEMGVEKINGEWKVSYYGFSG